MINLQTITNVSDCVPLYLPHSLYLKPVAKLSLSVSLPPNKMGKSISNFDIMDKLTKALAPDKFLILKVTKSTLEVIRLEAELEEPSRLQNALGRLDGMSFKVSGFTEHFKVRAKETKDEFPNRHDWDIFFRDAHYMDEMKAGERPDTIHFANMPIRWFCPRHMENDENVKPSESIFKRIFEKFGTVRAVDIPVCDVFRQKMSSDVNGIQVHNFEQDLLFEGYVQFEEYIGFVRAMDEFRGMKLVRKFVDKTQAINIIVNFDKKKHLSEASMLRRERMRKSLLAKVKSQEEEEEKKKKKEQEKIELERKLAEEIKMKELERQREREEQRKQKHLKKLQEKGQIELSRKIRLEEKKLLIVRRKLESIRILEALFERLKLKDIQGKGKSASYSSVDLRQRLVDKYKSATEKLLEEQKRKVESEKINTGLMGLLKHRRNDTAEGSSANGNIKENGKKKKKSHRASSDSSSSSSSEDESKKKNDSGPSADQIFNPFKDVYTPEAAAEIMKMSMLSYGVFPGMPVYRPSFPPAHAMRGYIPRGRGGGMRGPRRGGYNYHGSSGYPYKNYYNDYRNDGGMSHDYSDRHGGGYKNSRSYTRSRSRKRSRSRSRTRTRTRSRSHSRSRSRTRSRHRRYSRSRRSRHRSNSRSHSRSRSRSRSRSHRSRSKERSRSHSQSRVKENHPRNKSRSLSNSKAHSNRGRSESKEKQTRNRSHSDSRNHRLQSRSRSKSKTRSKRSRTTSRAKETTSQLRSKSRSQSKSKSKPQTTSSKDRANSRDRSDSKSRKTSSYMSKKRSKSKSHHSRHKSSKANSRSRSSSKNKTTSKKSPKVLVSTRRSHTPSSWSKSPSEPKRSWSAGEDP